MLDYLHETVQLFDVFSPAHLPIFIFNTQIVSIILLTAESVATPNLSKRRFLATSSTASYKRNE